MTEFIYYTDGDDTGLAKFSNVLKKIVGIETREKHDGQADVNVFKIRDTWKWIGTFTNNFRDDDVIPEIFSADSHRRYIDKVESGEKDLPELWIFHEEKWKIGKASFIALDEYDDNVVFVVVGGDIDPGYEAIAEKLAHPASPLKMSHGVPGKEIIRNKQDSTIFDEYWTVEVSIVPAGLEANPLTSFGLIGDTMITQQKREEIKVALGVDDSLLDGLEAANAQAAAVAAANGREHKSKTVEKEETVEAVETVDTSVVEETPAETIIDEAGVELQALGDTMPNEDMPTEVMEEEEEEEEEASGVGASLIHVLSGMAKSLDLIVDRLENTEKQFVELSEENKELKKAAEELPEIEEEVPAEAPAAFSIFDSFKSSIVGNGAAVNSADDGLNKSPAETKDSGKSRTGSIFVDNLIAGSRK